MGLMVFAWARNLVPTGLGNTRL